MALLKGQIARYAIFPLQVSTPPPHPNIVEMNVSACWVAILRAAPPLPETHARCDYSKWLVGFDEEVIKGCESRIFPKARVADIETHLTARQGRLGQHRQHRVSIRHLIGIEAKANGIASSGADAREKVDETDRVARCVASDLCD
jgi:hypothetical protein